MKTINKIKTESVEKLTDNLKTLSDFELKPYFEFEREDINSIFRDVMEYVEGGSLEIPDENYSSFDNQIIFIRDELGGYEKSDFENSKLIYTLFKLTPFEANDERIWVRLTHDLCRKYVINRWFKNGVKSRDVIKDRYFFSGRAQNTRVRNAISRLWWIAHLTVQTNTENEEQMWKFTKAVCETQEIIVSLFERRLVTYENVRFGFLEFYLENPNLFRINKGKKIQSLMRDLNNFGGVSILSLMPKDDIKDLIQKLLIQD